MEEVENEIAVDGLRSGEGRPRGTPRPKKKVFLDQEYAKEFVRIKCEVRRFQCWRCAVAKNSKQYYEWKTSQGVKEVCNGCYGNLLAMRPREPKQPKTKPEAASQEKKKRSRDEVLKEKTDKAVDDRKPEETKKSKKEAFARGLQESYENEIGKESEKKLRKEKKDKTEKKETKKK